MDDVMHVRGVLAGGRPGAIGATRAAQTQFLLFQGLRPRPLPSPRQNPKLQVCSHAGWRELVLGMRLGCGGRAALPSSWNR